MEHVPFILRFFYSYVFRHKYKYLLYLSMIVLSTIASGVMVPLAIRSFVDLLAADIPDAVRYTELTAVLWQIGTWSLVGVLAYAVMNCSITMLIPFVVRDIADDAFSWFLKLSYRYYVSTFIGGTVAKVKRAIDAMTEVEFHFTRGLFEAAIQFVVSVIVVSYFSTLLAVMFLVWGVVFISLNTFLLKWKMRADVRVSKADSNVSATLADSVTNVLNIKIFGRSDYEEERFAAVTQKKAHELMVSWFWSSGIEFMHGTFIGCMQVVFLFVSIELWRDGQISIGTIVLAQSYLFLVSQYLIKVGMQLKSLLRDLARCIEFAEVMQLVPDVQDPEKPEQVRISDGHIHFDTINFGYITEKAVFRNFTLDVPPGQKVGIVGQSGGGKSTLTKLLLRFMDIDEGQLLIDGQDIRSITQADLRRHISYVPQEPVLFHRSVFDNIAYGNVHATKEQVLEAARKAHADEFIEKLPQGYDTLVGERGVKLSGGERQRIAIARVMLEETPLLILDEATSSLDSLSEEYIQESFQLIMQNRTTIVIAHRLSTIRSLDRIVVIEDGAIQEDGTHEELLEHKGKYAALYEKQHEGFL